LTTFRDLLEPELISDGFANEYVRGGVNLLADLFGVVGQDVGSRMHDVLDDLARIPAGTRAEQVEAYGVRYDHDPSHLTITTNDVAHVLQCMGYGDASAQVLEGWSAGDRWYLPVDAEQRQEAEIATARALAAKDGYLLVDDDGQDVSAERAAGRA
jgi:hypothetical protein